MFVPRCNTCSGPLVGKSFKTPCFHIFCARCSYEHFSEHNECPACHHDLSAQPISELLLFATGANTGAQGDMQLSRQALIIEATILDPVGALQIVAETLRFLRAQMLLEGVCSSLYFITLLRFCCSPVSLSLFFFPTHPHASRTM